MAALTKGRYQKVSGSSLFGAVLDLTETRSPSFVHFVAAVTCLAELQE